MIWWRHRTVAWAVLVHHLRQAADEWREYVVAVRESSRR